MDKKKQNILIIILSIISIVIIILMFVLINKNQSLGNGDGSNQISFKVNYENEIVIDDTLSFKENESLYSLMERTYEIEVKQDGSMYAILSINEYKTDFVTSYFSLYVNGTYSTIGAKQLTLSGGMEIEWKCINL